ncbi:MAG: serine/threonine-protein kinase [Planctomycetota bacterium]
MDASEDALIAELVEAGQLTAEQVEDVREIQGRLSSMGLKARTLLSLLHERGAIDQDTYDDLERRRRRASGGEQIAGYRLLDRLGEGAMGAVYKARQLSLDRDVAIKVLSPDLAQDDEHVQRFLTEARAVARLNHTNIISGIDVGDSGGVRYLVMEYADGLTVADLLERGGAMDEERVLHIGQQMARALDHAHKANLIHRDVKPANILLTKDGVAKLSDFGLARLELDDADARRMGTPDYISPEQARGGKVDERTDLYSLGATLFHMLTGRPPYVGPDASSVLAQHLTAAVPSVLEEDPSIDARTDALVTRLLSKDPAARGRAKELAEEIESIVKALQHARLSEPMPGAGVVSRAAAANKPGASAAPAPVRRRRRR